MCTKVYAAIFSIKQGCLNAKKELEISAALQAAPWSAFRLWTEFPGSNSSPRTTIDIASRNCWF